MKSIVRLIEKSKADLAMTLIKDGWDVNQATKTGQTPLGAAIAAHEGVLLKLLIDHHANVNIPIGRDGTTPLMLAAVHGHSAAVPLLLAAGAELDAIDKSELTALCYAAMGDTVEKLEILQLLVEAGANLELGVSTPLACACRGLIEAVNILLTAGANPNSLSHGDSPLHIAIDENNEQLMQALLNHGANREIRSTEEGVEPGLTALEFGQKLKRQKLCTILQSQIGNTKSKTFDEPQSKILATTQSVRLLQENTSDLKFRPGVKGGLIDVFEKEIGLPLPESVKELYACTDGQKASSVVPLILSFQTYDNGYFLLSLKEVIRDWRMLNDLKNQGEFESRKAISDPQVRCSWWEEGWIPILGNRQGDYICVDLVPTKNGRIGQLILVNHESPERRLKYVSLESMLHQLAKV